MYKLDNLYITKVVPFYGISTEKNKSLYIYGNEGYYHICEKFEYFDRKDMIEKTVYRDVLDGIYYNDVKNFSMHPSVRKSIKFTDAFTDEVIKEGLIRKEQVPESIILTMLGYLNSENNKSNTPIISGNYYSSKVKKIK